MDTENKSKAIASIDIQFADPQMTPPRVDKQAWRQEMLEEHFHCVLCGSALTFRHRTDFAQHTVSEEAHCPACRVRNRQTSHTLQ